ncbi:uncharacterized protein RSE6_04443 [Rhynchosporium secalis]|uniref:Uncharacterized protein n=1 Tax=Rhynchosporium secalis TaxID=38038 RepID=A0A1E1M5C3_RHYSE|nr:uncharacterized protein RSE6_04443 [Rhynchosporium secalis]
MPLFTKKITGPPMTPEEARDAKDFEAYKLQQRTTAAREKYWGGEKWEAELERHHGLGTFGEGF